MVIAAGRQNDLILRKRSVDISISPSIGMMAHHCLLPIFPSIVQ